MECFGYKKGVVEACKHMRIKLLKDILAKLQGKKFSVDQYHAWAQLVHINM